MCVCCLYVLVPEAYLVKAKIPFGEVKLGSGWAHVMEAELKKSEPVCNNLNLLPVWFWKSKTSFISTPELWSVQIYSCSHQIWLTFAPVANQTAQYLKVSLEEVNWFSVIFMVVAIPLTIGATWMIDTLGLRITVQKYWYLTERSLVCKLLISQESPT